MFTKRNFMTMFIALIGVMNANAQRGIGRVNNLLQLVKQKADEWSEIVLIVKGAIYSVTVIIVMAKIISILSSKDSGEDKYMKAGVLFGILVVGSFIVWIAENSFG